jgi:hypothetical protein
MIPIKSFKAITVKPQTEEVVQRVTIISLGVLGSWSLQEISLWVAIISGMVAIVFGVVQTVKLLREWYLAERSRRNADPS